MFASRGGSSKLRAIAWPILASSLLLLGPSLGQDMAWANGDTTADAPAPASADVKKAVRKAPVTPKKKPKPKAQQKKPTPKKKATRRPAPPRESALDRGVALMQQERYEAARPWLMRAIQTDRRNAAAWYWYGMYHERTGKFYEAQYFYTKALEHDPTFDPLSRVVAYPGNGEKTPLWDPKRPARVYPIPTDARGMATIPPDAPQATRRPTRPPIDPELPKVPVYVPPEPGASPMDGDAWHPSVYVPPSMADAPMPMEEGAPLYVPPSSEAATAHGFQPSPSPAVLGDRDALDLPQPQAPTQLRDPVRRVDYPLYRPPLPGEGAATGQQQIAPSSGAGAAPEPTKAPAKKPKRPAPRKIVKVKSKEPAPAPPAPKKAPAKTSPAQELPPPEEPRIVPQVVEEPRTAPQNMEEPSVDPQTIPDAPPPSALRMEEPPPVGQGSPDDVAPTLPPVGQGEP